MVAVYNCRAAWQKDGMYQALPFVVLYHAMLTLIQTLHTESFFLFGLPVFVVHVLCLTATQDDLTKHCDSTPLPNYLSRCVKMTRFELLHQNLMLHKA